MNSRVKEVFQKNQKNVIALALIVLTFVLGEFVLVQFRGATRGSFLSFSQVLLTVRLATFIALFGLAQMIVISAGGGLDLSVGYVATISAVFTATIMDGQNANLPLAIIVAIIVGVAFGLLNGLLVAYAKLPSLIVTLAVSNIVQGIIQAWTSGHNITGRPSPMVQTVAAKLTGSFPNILIILIIVCIIVYFLINKTRVGVKLLSTGANETAAFLNGIPVKKVRCAAFIASGVIAALVGILLVGNSGQAYKDMGSIYVMPSVVAVVVGGVSIDGGEGNYFGVVLGAIVLQILTNLFVSLGWGDAGKWTGYGLILLAMLIAYVRNKRSR